MVSMELVIRKVFVLFVYLILQSCGTTKLPSNYTSNFVNYLRTESGECEATDSFIKIVNNYAGTDSLTILSSSFHPSDILIDDNNDVIGHNYAFIKIKMIDSLNHGYAYNLILLIDSNDFIHDSFITKYYKKDADTISYFISEIYGYDRSNMIIIWYDSSNLEPHLHPFSSKIRYKDFLVIDTLKMKFFKEEFYDKPKKEHGGY